MVLQPDGSFKAIAKPACIHPDAWKNLKGGKSPERLDCLTQFRKDHGLILCDSVEHGREMIAEEYLLWRKIQEEIKALAKAEDAQHDDALPPGAAVTLGEDDSDEETWGQPMLCATSSHEAR